MNYSIKNTRLISYLLIQPCIFIVYLCLYLSGFFRLAASRAFWNSVYNGGINAIPSTVAVNIPQKVVMPITRRLSAPAPEANNNGNTPKIKLHAVISTAR